MSPSCCSGKCSVALIFLILSAVPIAFLISLEQAVPSTHVISYHSSGFLRECAKWDDVGRRFLVSYMDGGGGIGELVPTKDSDDVLEEVTLVKDVDLAGNSSNGFVIDRHRNRLLLAVGDLLGNRYSALVAYDLSTWRRIFLTVLSSHSKEISYADDVAVDAQGNAYVSDAKGGKIWIVDVNGKLVYTIRSPLFTPPRWYNNFVSLNGIVYHPDGFLIVIHTFSGFLYKIDVTNGDVSSKVTVIDVSGGSLRFGDGLEFLSPTKIVVAGSPSSKLVESSDGWRTASVTGWFSSGMVHRLVSSATVKEGRVYLNHIVGFGSKKRHILVEAVF
ncbi:SMP-30/Gluconolactonase/LRE-like region [Arabidopsis suecica]|uniref:SMP-30/Gluconolactonase/LRE-like region n=1 Tax=Arabidopsis suecica TaxID=45249 RepID=A0A8T2G934_ARASU|nr:SMP-30/Gluconolactonase/LRE-like region [Arabidopsis suecica]